MLLPRIIVVCSSRCFFLFFACTLLLFCSLTRSLALSRSLVLCFIVFLFFRLKLEHTAHAIKHFCAASPSFINCAAHAAYAQLIFWPLRDLFIVDGFARELTAESANCHTGNRASLPLSPSLIIYALPFISVLSVRQLTSQFCDKSQSQFCDKLPKIDSKAEPCAFF